MTRRLFSAALLVVLLLSVLAPVHSTGVQAVDTQEARFLTLTDSHRATLGLPALKLSPKLTGASEWMSADMAVKDYFSHTDSLARDSFKRMSDFGYSYNTAKAENIAAGYTTADEVFDGWLNSAVHRANMESRNYLAIGIGRAYHADPTYGWYWTTDFGGVRDTTTSESLSGWQSRSGVYHV